MKNLANLLAQGKIDEVKMRALMTEYTRSVVRAVMIDSEEEYSRETTNVAGLPELADRISSRLAAAANMPLTLMMGQSPKGLGNEGDSDLEWWYNQIGGMQVEDTEKVERLCELVMLSKDGPTGGQVIQDYSIEWRPLFQPTDESTANARFLQSQTDEKYVTMGALSADDVATSRFGGEKYSFETAVDWAAREKAKAEREALAKQMAAAPLMSIGQRQPPAAPMPAQPKADAKSRVLFLDDMSARHQAFGKAVASQSVTVDHVHSAKEAIEMLNTNRYDQVFLDHDLSIEDIMISVGADSKVPTGMAVADHIVSMTTPPSEVIVHTGNPPAGAEMMRRLGQVQGMKVTRLPFSQLIQSMPKADEARADMIEHRGSKWVVLNHDGTKVLGTYDTEAEAKKRLAQIEAAKYATR